MPAAAVSRRGAGYWIEVAEGRFGGEAAVWAIGCRLTVAVFCPAREDGKWFCFVARRGCCGDASRWLFGVFSCGMLEWEKGVVVGFCLCCSSRNWLISVVNLVFRPCYCDGREKSSGVPRHLGALMLGADSHEASSPWKSERFLSI